MTARQHAIALSPPDDPRKLTAARSFKLGHDKVPNPFQHSGWPYVLEPGPLAERRLGWGKRQGKSLYVGDPIRFTGGGN